MIGPASHTAFVAVTLRGDYAAGDRAMRRILALGEARGYQPGTSHARFVFALLACWLGPIESGVHAGQRAREGLIAGGDMANGAYSYHPTVYYLLDCAPSLDACVDEVESGLAFVRRTGNEKAAQWLDSCRRLAAVLRGESAASAYEAVPIDRYADNPLALLHAHLGEAMAAAIFDDLDGLARHAAAVIPLLPAALGLYPTAVGRLLRGLALAGQVGDATRDDRFARDPYFADVDCCSLLALPVLGRGVLRAVLLLENQLIRGAFTTGRLDAVKLITGQLAVSLDNAQLYAGFRWMAEEQAALRRVATLVARATPPRGGVRRGCRGGRRAAGGRLHGPDPVRSGGT